MHTEEYQMINSRHKILYIQGPALGGTVTGLYDLVGGINLKKYEPVILFLEPSIYCDESKNLGFKVITARKYLMHGQTSHVSSSKRDIAASLNRVNSLLSEIYKNFKQFYLLVCKDLILANRLSCFIRDLNIDLVHHNNNLRSDRVSVLAAALTNVPQICHVRTLTNLFYTEKFISRFVNAFIYMSSVIQKAYLNHGIPNKKGTVIYDGFNTVDNSIFDKNKITFLRDEFGIKNGEHLICNIGRIDWWKGQDYFIKAMAKVLKVEPNTKVLIVGPTDSRPENQAFYLKLKNLVEKYKMSNNLIFAGFRSDVQNIMAASDVVVHSSSEPEPFGRVIVEGMLVEKPVVATSAGGVLDIIQDKVTGLLVPLKDAESMAAAILQLLQNPEQAKQIGARARERAKRRFSVEQHVTAVEEIYKKVLSQNEIL
jgi:glycosyltransferase involved in cell wall biosynthesis